MNFIGLFQELVNLMFILEVIVFLTFVFYILKQLFLLSVVGIPDGNINLCQNNITSEM